MKRIVVIMLTAVTVLLGFATAAQAHDILITPSPGKNASVAKSPKAVTLTFNDTVNEGPANQIEVTGPDGNRWAKGKVSAHGTMISRPLATLGKAGTYTVGYSVLSADGHTVRGQYSFRLTKDAGGKPVALGAPSESGGSGSGVSVWIWIAGAGVLLLVGLGVATRLGRQPSDQR